MKNELIITNDLDLSKKHITSIISLKKSVWENSEKMIDELVNDHIKKINRFNAQERKKRKFIRFVIWIEEVAIANAETFSRIINTMEGSLEVMGLGAVCVREDFRGNNYGKDVVIKSFNRIVRGEFDVALFQTEIPGFYKRFGAKTLFFTRYSSEINCS